jgi:membrane protein DedA with SNARE-associated domain
VHISISSLLQSYGYIVLFFLVGMESLGVPLPGETALLTAGATAARGRLDIAWVIAIAAAGAIVGDNTGYWIGRRGGLPLVHRYGRVLRVTDAKLERVRAVFERHGAKTVFFGRFIALLRTWAAVLAGVGQMRYRTFMLFNALGGITWAAIIGMLGYLFGRNLPRLEHFVRNTGWVLVVVVVVVGGGIVWWRRRRDQGRGARGQNRHRPEAREEGPERSEMPPGP